MSKLLMKNIRKVFGLVAVVAILSGVLVPAMPAFAYNATMAVTPSTLTVNPGASFSVTINVNTTNEVDTVGCQMDWSGPTGTLTCTGISAVTGSGSFWGTKTPIKLGGTYDPTTGTTGQVAFGFLGDYLPAGGNGPAMRFDFIATAAGTVTLDVYDAQVARSGTPLSLHVTDGSVQIGYTNLKVISKSETWVTPGVNYTVTYTIKNEGSAPSVASFTEIKIDGTQVLVEPCPILHQNATYTHTTTAIPYDVNSSGGDLVQVCADTDSVNPARNNLVIESNENDNCMTNSWGLNQMYFATTTTTKTVGSVFDVEVKLRSGVPARAAGFALRLTGTGDAVVTGIDKGNYFNPYPIISVGGDYDPVTRSTSQYAVTVLGAGSVANDEVLATVRFRAVSPGTVNVSLVDIQVKNEANNDIPVTAGNDHVITISLAEFYDIKVNSVNITYGTDGTFTVNTQVEKVGTKRAPEPVVTAIILGSTVLEEFSWAIGTGTGTINYTSGPHPLPKFPTYPIIPGTPSQDIPYNIRVHADYRNDCAGETSEVNNIVDTRLSDLPNLVVISKLETEVSPGRYSVTATVKNMGPGAAGASKLGVYLNNVRHGQADIPALNANESAIINYAGPIVADISHDIKVCADDLRTVTEWDETDNCLGAGAINFRYKDFSTTAVAGAILPLIEITCPGPINVWDWDWSPGTTQKITRTYNVRANVDWIVVATDVDTDTTAGHMLSWDGTYTGTPPNVQYVYKNVPAPFNSKVWLQSPLLVESDEDGDYIVNSPIIASGTVADQIGDYGEDFDVTFSQEINFQDPVLPHGWIYHITVELICGATF